MANYFISSCRWWWSQATTPSLHAMLHESSILSRKSIHLYCNQAPIGVSNKFITHLWVPWQLTQINSSFMYKCFFPPPGQWHWESIDGTISVPLPPPSVSSFVQQFDLCLTGEGLAQLAFNPHLLHTLLPHIRVFARVSPKQKVGSWSSTVKLQFLQGLCTLNKCLQQKLIDLICFRNL